MSYLFLANWVLFTLLASAAVVIVLCHFFAQRPLEQSVSLWAIVTGYLAMFMAQAAGFLSLGFMALIVSTCIVIGRGIFMAGQSSVSVGRVTREPDNLLDDEAFMERAVRDWERAEAYRKRIETKSPEFLQRALLIVVDKELRFMIDEQLAVYRQRKHIRRVA